MSDDIEARKRDIERLARFLIEKTAFGQDFVDELNAGVAEALFADGPAMQEPRPTEEADRRMLALLTRLDDMVARATGNERSIESSRRNRAVEIRRACRRVLRKTIDPIPPDVDASIEAIDDLDGLMALHRDLATAPDAAAARAILDRLR